MLEVGFAAECGAGVFEVAASDRHGNTTTIRCRARSIEVTNDAPDNRLPVAELVSPDAETVLDVGDGPQQVTVRARITDDTSGVDRAYASLAPPTGAHIASYPR